MDEISEQGNSGCKQPLIRVCVSFVPVKSAQETGGRKLIALMSPGKITSRTAKWMFFTALWISLYKAIRVQGQASFFIIIILFPTASCLRLNLCCLQTKSLHSCHDRFDFLGCCTVSYTAPLLPLPPPTPDRLFRKLGRVLVDVVFIDSLQTQSSKFLLCKKINDV